jgi:hypothetical protein
MCFGLSLTQFSIRSLFVCHVSGPIFETWVRLSRASLVNPKTLRDFVLFKGRFKLWPNFERRSVWTNENAEMPKVRPLNLHTRGRSPKDVASNRA